MRPRDHNFLICGRPAGTSLHAAVSRAPRPGLWTWRRYAADVLAQLPRASEEIEMGVTVEVEVGEIRHHVGRSVR